jgi:3-phosphoshikimate 1-carboxyvinyltransferase
MTSINLFLANKNINLQIDLPASKSISNRALILNKLAQSDIAIRNLSDSDDTRLLQNALNSSDSEIDIGAAGTAMRFLTACFAISEGEKILTGSERMKQRPIKIPVDALNALGADISYLQNEGFPPLKIVGKSLPGGAVTLKGNVSSQYVSALMMIAPVMHNGLEIRLEGEIVSLPYINMTAQIMELYGVKVNFSSNVIKIAPQTYLPVDFSVEPDWSAASYWYEFLAIAGKGSLLLQNLRAHSLQGDSKTAALFQNIGVSTSFTPTGAMLTANGNYIDEFSYNFSNEPDLVQTFVVTCCMLGIKFYFGGIQSLKIKESNRVAALIAEIRKMGYLLHETPDGILTWNGERCPPDADIQIETYQDHRMAMAFAPASLKYPITILKPEVVSKSYPKFWEDVKMISRKRK